MIFKTVWQVIVYWEEEEEEGLELDMDTLCLMHTTQWWEGGGLGSSFLRTRPPPTLTVASVPWAWRPARQPVSESTLQVSSTRVIILHHYTHKVVEQGWKGEDWAVARSQLQTLYIWCISHVQLISPVTTFPSYWPVYFALCINQALQTCFWQQLVNCWTTVGISCFLFLLNGKEFSQFSQQFPTVFKQLRNILKSSCVHTSKPRFL